MQNIVQWASKFCLSLRKIFEAYQQQSNFYLPIYNKVLTHACFNKSEQIIRKTGNDAKKEILMKEFERKKFKVKNLDYQ